MSSSVGMIIPKIWKNKHVPNHQTYVYIYRCDVDENGISKDGTLGGTLGLELCNGVVLLLIPRHSQHTGKKYDFF